MVFYQFFFDETIRLNFSLLAAGFNNVRLFIKYLVSYNFPILFMKSTRPWRQIFECANSSPMGTFFLIICLNVTQFEVIWIVDECRAVLTLYLL